MTARRNSPVHDGNLLALCQSVIEAAGLGHEDVEAYAVHEVKTSVWARDGAPAAVTSSDSWGLAVRVMSGGRLGFMSTSDLSSKGALSALARARHNAALADSRQGHLLPEAQPVPAFPSIAADGLARTSLEKKLELVLDLEHHATTLDPRARRVKAAAYADRLCHTVIASTKGISAEYFRTDCVMSVTTLASTKDETQTGFGVVMGRDIPDLDLVRCAHESVRRATRLLGGRRPSTRRVPVVFDPHVTAQLLTVLSPALAANGASRHRWLFGRRVGEAVAAARVSLVDDARLLDGPGARPFDDEGVPTQRTPIITDGVLTSFLHSTRTASLAGGTQRSTGSASRHGYGSVPEVAASNLFFHGETTPLDRLMALAGGGLYVQELWGVQSGTSVVTGEFSVAVTGVRIAADGSFGEPVRATTVSSTLPAMLESIVALSDDRRFLADGHAGTTLLLGPMTVAGT